MRIEGSFAATAARVVALPMAAALLMAGPALAQSKNLTLLGITSATTAPQGVGYVALSGTPDSPMNTRVDGSLELGFGLGSAEETVGFQGKVVVTSLTDDFGDSGYLGAKFSRRISAGPAPLYIGLEVDEFGGWGESSGNDTAVSIMLTGFSSVKDTPLMYTVGIGNDLADDGTEPGVFAGIGAGFNEYLGGSIAWTGQTIDLGLSLRPAAESPFILNIELNDLADRYDERRVSLSVAWVFNTGLGQ